MPKTKSIGKVLTGAMLSFALANLGGQVVQARPDLNRPVSLLRAKCVNSGLGSARQDDLNVSIGKAVYTSVFYLGPGNRYSSVTCKIQPERYAEPVFQQLQLGFGMRDNDARRSPAVDVNIYLDGKQAVSRRVAPAQLETVSLEVGSVSNIAIETVCSSQSQYCDRVYFFKASLDPKTPLPPPSTSSK